MYLEKAKELLEKEYKQRRKENVSGFLIEVMDEKIRHSYQVLGAGKYLLKHEPYFCNLSNEEKDFLQAVVLLHDVARFYEFLVLGQQGIKIDHGSYGAEMLEKIPEFNKMEAILPVRHHGHLIEMLYEDKDYQNLPSDMQEKVKRIAFLVRDADKLANFYLLVTKFKEMSPLFFAERVFKTPYAKTISAEARKDFEAKCTVKMKYVSNFAERALAYLSWVFDLNYISSFVFLEKLNIIERLGKCFSIFLTKEDDAKYTADIKQFIAKKLS